MKGRNFSIVIETFGIVFEQQSRERRAQSANNRRKEISKFQCKLQSCSGYSRLSCNFRSVKTEIPIFNNQCDDFLSLLSFLWKINLSLCAAFILEFLLIRWKKAIENWILFYVWASIVVNDLQLILFPVISLQNVEVFCCKLFQL